MNKDRWISINASSAITLTKYKRRIQRHQWKYFLLQILI